VLYIRLSSTLYKNDYQDQDLMETDIKSTFQYRVINLFMYVSSFLQFSYTASDISLHQLLINASLFSNKTLESCNI
jgi:hypothetical protein